MLMVEHMLSDLYALSPICSQIYRTVRMKGNVSHPHCPPHFFQPPAASGWNTEHLLEKDGKKGWTQQ